LRRAKVSPTALTSAEAAAATWASGAGFAFEAVLALGFAAGALAAGVLGTGFATASVIASADFDTGDLLALAGPALRGAAGVFGVCAISDHPFVDASRQTIDRSRIFAKCHIIVTSLCA
jgi:hypothetical protein